MSKPANPIWTPSPLTVGIRGYWLLHEGSGTTSAELSGSGAQDLQTADGDWTVGPYGPQYDTVDNETVYAGTDLLQGANWTWAVLLRWEPTSTFRTVLGAQSAVGLAAAIRSGDTLDSLSFRYRNQVDDFTGSITSSTPITTGADHVVVVTYAPGADEVKLYLDGTEVGSQRGDAAGLDLAGYAGILSPHGNQHGPLIAMAEWGRTLTPSEVAELSTDWLSGTFAAAGGGGTPSISTYPAALLMGL